MRCYAVLDTFRELEAFSGRAVYLHMRDFLEMLEQNAIG